MAHTQRRFALLGQCGEYCAARQERSANRFRKGHSRFHGASPADQVLRNEVEERRETQRKLQESERSLRQLSLRLLQSQDEERRRIGRDLHNSVGQYLVALKMKLDSLNSGAARNQFNVGALAECVSLTEEALKEVRTVSYLLYPPLLWKSWV